MRPYLRLVLVLLTVAVVSAGRRGMPSVPSSTSEHHRHHLLQPWGIGGPLIPPSTLVDDKEEKKEDKSKAVKEVKNVAPKKGEFSQTSASVPGEPPVREERSSIRAALSGFPSHTSIDGWGHMRCYVKDELYCRIFSLAEGVHYILCVVTSFPPVWLTSDRFLFLPPSFRRPSTHQAKILCSAQNPQARRKRETNTTPKLAVSGGSKGSGLERRRPSRPPGAGLARSA